ncbi:MAG: hypothetical protein Q8N30_16975 [Methylococcales bacterium]|nr:hypothetical protein [Methylococcales bacterium]
MSFRDKFSEFSHLGTDWQRVLTRGVLMLVIGVTLIALTIFKPNVMLFHVRDTSWFPVCGFVLLAVGLLECFDALIAKELKDFFLNLQNGILDVVVAVLLVLSSGDDPVRLSLLIAAFLMIKGIFRIIISYAINSANVTATRIGAGLSILFGLFIWMQWPSSAAWFLAFCLSSEIALRGWATLTLALWLQSQQVPE